MLELDLRDQRRVYTRGMKAACELVLRDCDLSERDRETVEAMMAGYNQTIADLQPPVEP